MAATRFSWRVRRSFSYFGLIIVLSLLVRTGWSAGARQHERSSLRTGVIISEIMHHPSPGYVGKMEFVELYNSEPVACDISGWRLSADADYVFPPGTEIKARSYLVVAADPGFVESFYSISGVMGPMSNELYSASGRVRLRNGHDAVLLEARYSVDPPWPTAADGAGHSQVLAYPDRGEDNAEAWEASAFIHGNPGESDPLGASDLDNIVVNEILANAGSGQVDFIEIFNRGDGTVDMSGCVLTDQAGVAKWTVPSGTTISSRGFGAWNQTTLGFGLNEHGGRIYLLNPGKDRVVAALAFGAQGKGASMGRYPDGTAGFCVLSSPTMKSSNSKPENNTVVINEIMYRPISGRDDGEYIELHNRGSSSVDVGNWQIVDGISFVIPDGVSIGANGYLVIAKNAGDLIERYSQLNAGNTLGDYSGSLSDRGERIALVRPENPDLPFQDLVIVDEVTYGDGDIWGKWADGGGSSLELIDPRSDNRLPMNWAGSDETEKASWSTIEHTGVLDDGMAECTELHMFFPQAGECLVDNVEVSTSGGSRNLYDDFESGLGKWDYEDGNHERSSLETSEGYDSSSSFHIRASGKGEVLINSGHALWESVKNQASAELSPDPSPGQTVTIRAKVRWLCGWPYFVLGLQGFWLEAADQMQIPDNLGTPGAVNSRYKSNTGPAISEVIHDPVLPGSGKSVVVSARVHDPDGIASVQLKWRNDTDSPSTTHTLAMNDDGTDGDAFADDGIYGVSVSGLEKGRTMAFYVEASDSRSSPAKNRLPSDAPARECLVLFGEDLPGGELASMRMWMTRAVYNEWTTRDLHSNEPLDVTIVYNDYRVAYNAGARYRGGWRGNDSPKVAGAYSVGLQKSDRMLGVSELKIDQSGQENSDDTMQIERHSFWIAEQLGMPCNEAQYVHFFIDGASRGVFRNIDTPGTDYAKSRNPDDDDPQVFKLYKDRPYEPPAFADHTSGGEKKKERYRWNWRKRKTGVPDDDFSPLYPLVDALDVSDNDLYDKRVAAVMDAEQCLGYFAVNHILMNIDSYGYEWPHNLSVYVSPDRGCEFYLYDLDWSLGGGWSTGNDLFLGGDSITKRLWTRPVFRRIYWRYMQNAVDGPLNSSNSSPVLDAWYNALKNNGASVSSPDSLKSWISTRRDYIRSRLAEVATSFKITSNGGSDFSTSDTVVTLTGTAPVEVKTITVNGTPHDLTFTSVTDWELHVGLNEGANVLTVAGLDRHGDPVADASDKITVTCTGSVASPAGYVLISEIMYHPSAPHAEFIELHNRSSSKTFSLAGFRLNGADLIFGGGAFIEPGGYIVVAESRRAYQAVYGNAEVLVGEYDGSLDNGGETLTLFMPSGSNWVPIDQVKYSDDPPWPMSADGYGRSLVPVSYDTSVDRSDPSQWRGSKYEGGSPGKADPAQDPTPAILVNEALTHTDEPLRDTIELYNPTDSSVDLAGWYLTDSRNNLKQWKIPSGHTIPARGYALFYEGHYENHVLKFSGSEFGSAFSLSSAGDDVYLVSPNLDYISGFSFEGAFNGISFGRYTTSVGTDFPAQTTRTLGSANAGPAFGPVVINEIMYHPDNNDPDPVNHDYEFLELKNISGGTVKLYDENNTSNTWKVNGLSFDFPMGVEMAPWDIILLVKDTITPALFRAKYGVPASVDIYNFAGSMDNGSETISVMAPDGPIQVGPNAGIVPYVVIDRVKYADNAPWPLEADGGGPSLERINENAYGNEPANWAKSDAKGGTPGVAHPPPTTPRIAVSKADISVSAIVGSNATAEAFDVWNSGINTLNYTIAESTNVFAVAPGSGASTGPGDKTTHNVTFSTAGLAIGTYNESITVSSAGATNSPVIIPVTIAITQPPTPAIGRNVSSLSPSCSAGGNASNQVFKVWNAGIGTLDYNILDNAGWLSVDPNSGTSAGPQNTHTVTYDTDTLAVGSYSATITVVDSNATNSPQMIPVYLSVLDQPLVVEVRIASGLDDIEERENDSMYVNSTDLELTTDVAPNGVQKIGLRFTGVDIPRGANIASAYVEFTADLDTSGGSSLKIEGEDVDDAAAFVNVVSNLSVRTVTSASVDWTPSAWTDGVKYQTPDITGVIQEIVSRGGWTNGNALVLKITGTGTRRAEAYEGSPTEAALLHVEYRPGGSPTDADGDGMPDAWETQHFGGTNTSSGTAGEDYDGDGFCDLFEFYAGTDPTNAASLLKVVQMSPDAASNFVLDWASVAGKVYSVKWIADMTTPPWGTVASNIAATPPMNVYTVSVTGVESGFYRVDVQH